MALFPHFNREEQSIELRKAEASGKSTLIEDLTVQGAKALAKALNAMANEVSK